MIRARFKQKLSFDTTHTEEHVEVTDMVRSQEIRTVKLEKKKFIDQPRFDEFTLEDQIKAGVPMDYVPTKVLTNERVYLQDNTPYQPQQPQQPQQQEEPTKE